jgi:hypothetical protein
MPTSRRRRSSVRWVAPAIEVTADFHGQRLVRDVVLREVHALTGTRD